MLGFDDAVAGGLALAFFSYFDTQCVLNLCTGSNMDYGSRIGSRLSYQVKCMEVLEAVNQLSTRNVLGQGATRRTVSLFLETNTCQVSTVV